MNSVKFNIEYLGHIFETNSDKSKFIFKCKKCQIKIWTDILNRNKRYFIKSSLDSISYDKYLDLTCEQQQIKNLLE